MKTVLKSVRILDPQQQIDTKTDMLIEDGIIVKIGGINEQNEEMKVLEMNGVCAAPGFYDMHVHLREPGKEDTETVKTGCAAAAAGGFTGVACMPNTTPAIDSAEVITLIKNKAAGLPVDVDPFAAVSLGREGEVLAPMAELIEAGAVGFSDDGTAVQSAQLLRFALEYAMMFNAPISEHAEDQSLADGAMNEGLNSTTFGIPGIPSIAEDIIVARDIQVAEYTGGRIHIGHISTKNSVEMVRQAKKKGIKVTCEVTPHHFTLTDDALVTYNTNFKMNPPLRGEEDRLAMIEGLKDGTIDCIASDHAPHSIEDKEREFIYAPNGIIGLETAVGLAFSQLYHKNILTIEQIIEKFAYNPRKILNLELPALKEGTKANITLFAPDEEWTVDKKSFKSKSRNTPFNGYKLRGKPVGVINNGKIYYQDSFSDA